MKRMIVLLLICLSPIVAAAEESPRTLAVLDLENQAGVAAEISKVLSDALRTEVVGLKKFQVVDRAHMDQIMAEHQFQLSDLANCQSAECKIKVGRLLGVQMMLVGTIGKLGDAYLLNLQAIEIETGLIAASTREKCVCEVEQLDVLVAGAVRKLFPCAEQTAAQQAAAAPPSRYIINTDGTVTDTRSGLIWQRYDDGKKRKWREAIDYCDSLKLGDSRNWRLPNKDELISLIVTRDSRAAGAPRGAYDTWAFGDWTGSGYYWFWSATVNQESPDGAWRVDFDGGSVYNYNKTSSSYVRCVRSK